MRLTIRPNGGIVTFCVAIQLPCWSAVFVCLGSGDRQGLATWLARLPADAQDKDEWRYWRASLLLLEQGKKTEGEAILRSLMQERGFYPMVAAQNWGFNIPLMLR